MKRTTKIVVIGASTLLAMTACTAGLAAIGSTMEPTTPVAQPTTTAVASPEPTATSEPTPTATVDPAPTPEPSTASPVALRGAVPVEPGSLLDQLEAIGLAPDLTNYVGPAEYTWLPGEAAWHCRAFLADTAMVDGTDEERGDAVQALLLTRVAEHPEEDVETSAAALTANVEHCSAIATADLP